MVNQGSDAAASEGDRKVSHRSTLGMLVRGKNINEKTLLATDYLNHYNEIIMLVELLPDMPDCLEEAQAWKPKSYQEHFRDSSFTDKDLAILAYENAPPEFREPFDRTVKHLDTLISRGLCDVAFAIDCGEPEQLRLVVEPLTQRLRQLVDMASAIIHGQPQAVDQAEIDRILEA